MVHVKNLIQEIARRASRQIRVVGSRSRRQPQAKPGNSQWLVRFVIDSAKHVPAHVLVYLLFELINNSSLIIHQT